MVKMKHVWNHHLYKGVIPQEASAAGWKPMLPLSFLKCLKYQPHDGLLKKAYIFRVHMAEASWWAFRPVSETLGHLFFWVKSFQTHWIAIDSLLVTVGLWHFRTGPKSLMLIQWHIIMKSGRFSAVRPAIQSNLKQSRTSTHATIQYATTGLIQVTSELVAARCKTLQFLRRRCLITLQFDQVVSSTVFPPSIHCHANRGCHSLYM